LKWFLNRILKLIINLPLFIFFYNEKKPKTRPVDRSFKASLCDNNPLGVDSIKNEDPVRLFNKRKVLYEIKKNFEGFEITLIDVPTFIFL